MKFILPVVMSIIFSVPAFAEEHPCKQIKEICQKAGFKKGESKTGKGLWVNCIDPIMQGTTSSKSALPLPQVDSALIEACKKKHTHLMEHHKIKEDNK